MDRICQYSTIIFAGNVSVLLIVAVSTDYWEYRGFKTEELIPKLKKMHTRLKLFFPSDTSSYFVVKYYWDPPPIKTSIFATTPIPKKEVIVANYTLVYYQPPVVLLKKVEEFIETEFTVQYDGKNNITVGTPVKRKRSVEDTLVLYVQYTNLFRECDILEVGVRARLGLSNLRTQRCFNFITSSRSNDFISQEIPAAMHLERIAFIMSLVCIVVSLISLVSGAYGLIAHDRSYILTASSAACASGIAMTVSIAIFHGKCHLIHRHDFLAGVDLPFKKAVEELRDHYYGWSFVLAWICVVLSFVHTWVWLAKAQDMPDLCLPGRRRWGLGLFRVKKRRRRKWRKRKRFHLAGTTEKLRKLGEHNKKKQQQRRGSLSRWGSTRHLNVMDFALIPKKGEIGDKEASQEDPIYCAIPMILKSVRSMENHIDQPPANRNRRWSDGATRGPSLAMRARLEAAAMNGVSVGNIYRNHIDACSLKKCTSGEYYKVLQRPKSEFKILVQPTEFKMYKQPCDCDHTAWKYPSESKLASKRLTDKAFHGTRSQISINSVQSRINIANSRFNINQSESQPNIRLAKSQTNIIKIDSQSDMLKSDSRIFLEREDSQANITGAESQTSVFIPNRLNKINSTDSQISVNSHVSFYMADSQKSIPGAKSNVDITIPHSQTDLDLAESQPNIYSQVGGNLSGVDSEANINVENPYASISHLDRDTHSRILGLNGQSKANGSQNHVQIFTAKSQTNICATDSPKTHFIGADSYPNIASVNKNSSMYDVNSHSKLFP